MNMLYNMGAADIRWIVTVAMFISGTLLAVLIGFNIAIYVALATHQLKTAAKMQGILERIAWPLKLGGRQSGEP